MQSFNSSIFGIAILCMGSLTAMPALAQVRTYQPGTTSDACGGGCDPEIFLDACKTGHGSKEECEWQKQCMAADHPGWAGKSKQDFARACAVDYKEFGSSLRTYPNFHYDSKSFRSNSGEYKDGETGAKLSCALMDAEKKARGFSCASYSIEFRQMDEAAKRQWYGLKPLANRVKSHFVDEVTPAELQPAHPHGLP